MIYGARYWDDKDKYYIQTNNPTEEIIRKVTDEGTSFLESCGSTAAVNCLAVHNYPLEIICPGAYKPQPEEILNDWFNDPRNYKLLAQVRKDIGPSDLPGNRVPQYYKQGVWSVFGVYCIFWWITTHHELVDFFKIGHTIQLCLKSPSHYVAAVAYDTDTSEFIINDPWPGRFPDGNGFNRRISSIDNLMPFAILYPAPTPTED